MGTPLQDSVAGKTVTGVRVAPILNPALAFNAVRSEPAPGPKLSGVKVASPTVTGPAVKSAPLRVGVPLVDSVQASTVARPVVHAKGPNLSAPLIDVTRVTAHSPVAAHAQKVSSPVVNGQAVRCAPTRLGAPIVDSVVGVPVLAPVVARTVERSAVVVEAMAPVNVGDPLYSGTSPSIYGASELLVPLNGGMVVPEPVVMSGYVRIEVDTRSPVVVPEPVFHGPAVELGQPVVDALSDSPVTVPGVTGDVSLHEPGYAYHVDRAPIQRRRRRRKKL